MSCAGGDVPVVVRRIVVQIQRPRALGPVVTVAATDGDRSRPCFLDPTSYHSADLDQHLLEIFVFLEWQEV